jgi:uncharacterized membrane protein
MFSILLAPLSPFGLILGAAAFVAALTPSMIPRPGVLQGVEAGIAFALLYGVGTGARALWSWLELPVAGDHYPRAFLRTAILLCLALVGYGLVREIDWQNAIRRSMGMPPVPAGLPVLIAIVSAPVALFLIGVARLFNASAMLISARLAKLVPRRIALLVGFGIAAALFWTIGNGLLLRTALHQFDSSYRRIDALMPAELSVPEDPFKSGSSKSLVSWASLGAQGRKRVVAVPSKSDISSLTTGSTMEPLRVYVGLNSAETVEQRAGLALAELKRVRAFDRAVLVIATPTGTGWVDPAGMAPLEILHRGDVASVSVQYSYLPSWLSLLVEPDYGADTARAVFRVVYDYWRALPKERRPRLYLFGLSLGARNSDLSADLFDVIADPYQGALWVGPPWDTVTWRNVTAMRAAGSPVWLPRFRDEALFHFTTQRNELNEANMRWGPMRMVFLQYPSDPIVFFESASLWSPPSWMKQPRGPDVAPEIRWMPVVTLVQQICDMMTATTTPRGVGHVYAAAHYLDGWIAVTEPQGWNEESLARLREWLNEHDL